MADKASYLIKEGGKFKTWKKRWCVLKNNVIYYSKKQNSGELGIIRLHGVSVDQVYISQRKKKKNCFEVVTPTRTYFLVAESETEMMLWIESVKQSIQGKANSGGGEGQPPRIGVADFDLLNVIGKGSFGKVLQVRKKDNGKVYAMKVLNKKNILENNELEHTRTEKNILQKLIHPFLVNLNYCFQTADKLYFVMDFINGGELFYHLQKEHKFTPDRVRYYCAEIVLGLEYLHNSGVIYRDLKPENILLTDAGHIILTDFGISKEGLEAEDARTATFCGTPEYLAPEVLEGKGYTKAVDWWSFGTLMYEMLTGLPPFYSQDVQQMYFKIMHAKLELPDSLDNGTKSILTGLLERDANKRLADSSAIKSHPYFHGLDWDKLLKKEIAPPYIPPVKDKNDIGMVDPAFTSERVTLSEGSDESAAKISKESQKKFEGFTFIPETDIDYKK
jgi:RAC serine/threonine-protein kinase